jgi:SnoaL-like domain
MSAEANIQTIKTAYDAFGRGDVDTMLGLMTDDVDWASEASTKGAPWYGPHHGKAEVAQFFQEFGGAVEVQEFSPVSFAGNDTDVFALVHGPRDWSLGVHGPAPLLPVPRRPGRVLPGHRGHRPDRMGDAGVETDVS